KGIRPEFLPHIFERFRQEDASASREHGGLGIGLALVKQLVELHGGKVRAESAGEGQGATFTIELPVAVTRTLVQGRAHPRTLTAGSEGQELPDLYGLKVLIVDDEQDARELL